MVQHLIEDHADAPTLTFLAVQRLEVCFWSHIRRRANVEDPANLGRMDDFAEAEVYDDRVELFVDYDVGGLEVSMENIDADQRANRFQYLAKDMTSLLFTEKRSS